MVTQRLEQEEVSASLLSPRSSLIKLEDIEIPIENMCKFIYDRSCLEQSTIVRICYLWAHIIFNECEYPVFVDLIEIS